MAVDFVLVVSLQTPFSVSQSVNTSVGNEGKDRESYTKQWTLSVEVLYIRGPSLSSPSFQKHNQLPCWPRECSCSYMKILNWRCNVLVNVETSPTPQADRTRDAARGQSRQRLVGLGVEPTAARCGIEVEVAMFQGMARRCANHDGDGGHVGAGPTRHYISFVSY